MTNKEFLENLSTENFSAVVCGRVAISIKKFKNLGLNKSDMTDCVKYDFELWLDSEFSEDDTD